MAKSTYQEYGGEHESKAAVSCVFPQAVGATRRAAA